jgi:hypothetical protein
VSWRLLVGRAAPWFGHRSYSTTSEEPPLSNFNSYRDISWDAAGGVIAPGETAAFLVSQTETDRRLTIDEYKAISETGTLPLAVFGAIRYHAGFPSLIGETGFGRTYAANLTVLEVDARFSMTDQAGYEYVN